MPGGPRSPHGEPPKDDTPPRILFQDLGRRLRQKRTDEGISLRQAAEMAGVSFTTLSRVEAGAQPDLATFLNLCVWLGEPPERFFAPTARRPAGEIDQAIRHLYTDPRLPKDAAEQIAGVLRQMYRALARDLELPDKSLTLHLRAASVMRPGVPERLGAILQDMKSALETRLAPQTHK